MNPRVGTSDNPIPKPLYPGLPGRLLCTLAGCLALIVSALPAKAATLTYNFNNGTLQGWHNRVWDLSANNGSGGWVELEPNATAVPFTINDGALQPPSGDNGLFGNNGSQVDPVGGHNDNHMNTIWLRSPQFALDGSGDLTVQMARGRAHGAVPANESGVAFTADGSTGWKGVILHNVATGAFVLAKPRTSEGDAMVTVTFTAAELAPFVGVACTLDLINAERGGWGWLSMDNASIPGVLRQSQLSVTAPSVATGGSTVAVVTIPADFNASSSVTAYLTNGSPGRVTLNGNAGAVVPVTFAAGGPSSQNVTVTGVSIGYVPLTLGCVGLEASRSGVTVLTSSGLIGRWFTGSEDLLDKSGFSPAGTHDGILSGDLVPAFSTDVPPGATGSSLDLQTSGGAVLITNTMSKDPGYRSTFDEMTVRQFSVAFWAKGVPAGWSPYASKWGEGSTGWQVRRRTSAPVATFTLRGTPGEDDPYNGSTLIDDGAWHHFAATWDGVSGLRKLYVDGRLDGVVPHDGGPMGLAKGNYLTLGGRSGAGSTTPGNTLSGQLFDVRIYGMALTGSEVQSIYTANTSAVVIHSETTSIDLGKTGIVTVSIPATANASASVTVLVTSSTPAIGSISGAVANVATLTFPAGGPVSQTLTLTGLAEGSARLDCSSTGLTGASLTVRVCGQHLIGRWFSGAESYVDTSGFAPAGTHDGGEVGNLGGLSFSIDTPPSKSGKAAKFDGNVGLVIANSCMLDAGYLPTFDDLIARQFSVAFWAKGIPGTWNAFVSKRGEEAIGWQMRRGGGITEAFTIRGSGSSNADGVGSTAINDGQWHHYTAVWDGYTGTRKCYIDGNLDPGINITGDTAPMVMASNHRLVLGARDTGAVSSSPAIEGGLNGLLYDVQMFNYPLSATQAKDLSFIPAIKVAPALRSLHAPLTMTVDVILPAGANQSQAVSLQVTDNTPTIASLSGAVGNVLTLTYPVGGSLTQQVTVAGIKDGTARITATGGGFIAGTTTFNVWADAGTKLIGQWITGATDLADKSGFRPAGTHDGYAVGGNAGALTFNGDVPPGYTGQSLDLSAGSVAVMITNSAASELGYVETFDNQMADKFSISFWAKGTPAATWDQWISKRGEDNLGYQVRRHSDTTPCRPTFTLRGTAGEDDPWAGATVDSDNWHHYAATWDGTTGVRKLYVDGTSIIGLSGDFGPMALATGDHLVIGGRDQGGYGHFFQGLLYDVRIYSYALSQLDIGVLVAPPTSFTIGLSTLVTPPNETLQLIVTLPSGATATSPVTVYLTNNSPTVATIVGSTGNVYALTFPVGALVQAVSLRTIGLGQINITAGAAGVGSAALATVNTVVAPKLVGHWFNGAAELADKSGYTSGGIHDAVVVGANPELLAYSADVPPGFQGQSLDLTANANGSVGVIVANSAMTDAGYLPTFDEGISSTFSVALWAKGVPAGWDGFINKRGEDGIGWQVRRSGGEFEAFTIRGSASGNFDGVGSISITDGSQWHHFAAVWDGITGIRQCYVDGVLDPSVNLTGDYAPMSMAPNHHVGIGAREQAGTGSYESWFNGKLCDVRIYNYAITPAEIASISTLAVARPAVTIQAWTGNQWRISWPASFTGYSVEQASGVTSGWSASGLTVTVDGNQNVAYAPAGASAKFFRLKK